MAIKKKQPKEKNAETNFWPSGHGKMVFLVHTSLEEMAEFFEKTVQIDHDLRFLFLNTEEIGPVTFVEETLISANEIGIFVDAKLKPKQYHGYVIGKLEERFQLEEVPPEVFLD